MTAALALLQMNSARAIELEHRVGIGAGFGAAIPVFSKPFRDSTFSGWSANGRVDYYFSNSFGIEGAYHRLQYKYNAPITNAFNLNAIFRLMGEANFTPVLGIGAGYANTFGDADPSFNFNNFMATAKFGFDFTLCPHVILGLNAKYDWMFASGNGRRAEHGLLPQLDLTYFFGGAEPLAEAIVPAAVVPAPSAPADGDDDGDGVPNSIDKCPNTPAGVKVNSLGCPIEEAANFTLDIEFDSGKSIIKSEFHDELDKMGKLLEAHSDIVTEIQGYSDNVGKESQNIRLSGARAKAVANYLLKNFNLKKTQISSKGYGPANPVGDNLTAEGRKKNRRVIASAKSN